MLFNSFFCAAGMLRAQVLREVLHCRLPVELAWQGSQEMTNDTLAALQQQYGPLSGFDVMAMPYPRHLRRCATRSSVKEPQCVAKHELPQDASSSSNSRIRCTSSRSAAC
jgi:hypothetical protein